MNSTWSTARGPGSAHVRWKAHPSSDRWRGVLDMVHLGQWWCDKEMSRSSNFHVAYQPRCIILLDGSKFCSPIWSLIFVLLYRQKRKSIVKIILHRIISVVWLTNFPSEIRNLTNPRWWVEQQFLSVKRNWSPSRTPVHWWSLIFLYWKMEGIGAVWVVSKGIMRFSFTKRD